MKIAAILRIKDDILFVEDCLSKLTELVDKIIILDNGSTDGTQNVYSKFPKVTKILHTEGYHEGRDKIMLLEEVKKHNPDWILWQDADEFIENNFSRKDIEKYMNSKYDRVVFRMCHFWLDRENFRYDHGYLLYSLHPIRSMWSNKIETHFKDQKMHSGDIVGNFKKTYFSPYRFKHYGYSNRGKVAEKYKRYKREDSSGERNYEVSISPEFPAKTIKFIEFDNHALNTVYIYIYKYVANVVWLCLRVKLKLFGLFKHKK